MTKQESNSKKQELQTRAYSVYAAIGELTLKHKQLKQQEHQINEKLDALEAEIVSISKSLEALSLEGVSNVD